MTVPAPDRPTDLRTKVALDTMARPYLDLLALDLLRAEAADRAAEYPQTHRDPGTLAYAYAFAVLWFTDDDTIELHDVAANVAHAAERVDACPVCLARQPVLPVVPETDTLKHAPWCVVPF